MRKASEKYEVSLGTLSHRRNKKQNKKVGRPTALSELEEEAIVSQLLTCAEGGFPVDCFELKLIVKSYLESVGKRVDCFKNNVPGRDFNNSFLDRHRSKLRLRTVANYSKKHASVSSEMLNEYYDNLEVTIQDVPFSNIYNYDETNLTDNPGKKKCIVKRGAKYPSKIKK